jgi:hypothetical protein
MTSSGEGQGPPPWDGEGQHVRAEVGVPNFEHDQYTFEGEIERLGAFATGAARAKGAKRIIAICLVLLIVGPAVVALIYQAVLLFTH